MMTPEAIWQLIDRHGIFREEKEEDGVPTIHVDEIALKVAAFYERVRNIVDYQEEHLLRKNFVARALKRRIALRGKKPIAEALIKDIVRSGHLPNDTVPEAMVETVNRTIINHKAALKSLRGLSRARLRRMARWLFRMTSIAIEETLFPPKKDKFLADLMFSVLRERVVVHGAAISSAEFETQLFLSIERALLRVDRDQLEYRLLTFLYPRWAESAFGEGAAAPVHVMEVRESIARALRHPYGQDFFNVASRYNTVFSVLGDAVFTAENREDLARVLRDSQELEPRVISAYKRRFSRARGRLKRFAFLSVISFFISKIAVALAIEIPIERNFTHDFSTLNTIINIIFPPLLMLVIVLAIRMPGGKNRELALEEIKGILAGEEKQYLLTIPKEKTAVAKFFVQLFYAALFVGIFAGTAKLLLWFGFSVANIVVFIFFTSLVAATGVRVHNRSRELSLEEKGGSMALFLLDLIAMPFVTVGKWLVAGLSAFNVFVTIFNILVDVPLHVFVEFLENFRDFIRGKKEAIH